TGVTIPGGSTTASFYFEDTRSGTPLLTAAAGGLTNGTPTETITAAAVSKLVFTSAPQTLGAGACSAQVTVQSQDTFGNASTVGSATSVNLSSAPAGATFYAAAGCGGGAISAVTIASGASSATFY